MMMGSIQFHYSITPNIFRGMKVESSKILLVYLKYQIHDIVIRCSEQLPVLLITPLDFKVIL